MKKNLAPALLVALAVSGCGNGGGAAASSPPVDRINEIGFSMIKVKPVGYSELCDRIENMHVIDRIDRTAGALKHPAYVIGYTFDCLSSIAGKDTKTLYIGFVHNTDKGRYECIHWNGEKSAVLENTWAECGGLQ